MSSIQMAICGFVGIIPIFKQPLIHTKCWCALASCSCSPFSVAWIASRPFHIAVPLRRFPRPAGHVNWGWWLANTKMKSLKHSTQMHSKNCNASNLHGLHPTIALREKHLLNLFLPLDPQAWSVFQDLSSKIWGKLWELGFCDAAWPPSCGASGQSHPPRGRLPSGSWCRRCWGLR